MVLDQELIDRTRRVITELSADWAGLEEEYDLDDNDTDDERMFCGEVASTLDEVLDILDDLPSATEDGRETPGQGDAGWEHQPRTGKQ